MTVSDQHHANLAADSYRLDHRVGYHPPGNRDKVRMDGAVYEVVEFVDNKKTGYQGVIYQRMGTGEIVVAHRGTEFDREPIRDGLFADGGMVTRQVNSQAENAVALTKRALGHAQEYAIDNMTKVPEVTVTGHSLGGTLAQVSAHHFGLKGHTFNAYGAAGLSMRIPEGGHDVVNHVMAGDVVSAASPHYGKTVIYAVENDLTRLQANGYGRLLPDMPLTAAAALSGSHSMHHFIDVDAAKRKDISVLSEDAANARAIAQQHAEMIDDYRTQVRVIRSGLTALSSFGNAMVPAIGLYNHLSERNRAPLEPGEPARLEAKQAAPEERTPAPRSQKAGNPQAALDQDTAPTSRAAPSLENDPIGFLDRMLAAAKSGDNASFREMTQQAAAGEGGRALRERAVAAVDLQEQQAREHAAQAMQEATTRQARQSSGPVLG